MLGYTAVPYKDFLFVPDENNSQKIFTFDIQRDQTDWHSMNGGGFLFNTTIDKESNTISGYYILIMRDGLRLYELDTVNLNTLYSRQRLWTDHKSCKSWLFTEIVFHVCKHYHADH